MYHEVWYSEIILPTDCKYVLRIVLGTTSNSIPTQRSLIGFTTENECVYCEVRTKYVFKSNKVSLTL
jgi:thioredoxin-related protein